MANPTEPFPARRYWVAIVALALALRIAVLLAFASSHSPQWFFDEASELAKLADSVRAGHGFSSPFGGSTGPSAFLAPGYPLMVAAVFAIFHPYSHAAMLALMLLQALFGTATVLVTMLLAKRAFGTAAAYLAGAFLAICPPALFLPTVFWETSLSILLATSLLALALASTGKPALQPWIFMGLTAALALAVNPSLLPIAACSFGWATYKTRALTKAACCLAICILCLSPWTIRNYEQFHRFIPFRSNVGYELWHGNRAGSDGYFDGKLHLNQNPAEFSRYAALGEIAYMTEKGQLARRDIAANPGRFARLTAKRTLSFWIGRGHQGLTPLVAYLLLTSALGLLGLTILWRRNRSLALLFLCSIVLFSLPYCITHPDARFRLVIDPILIALSTYALISLRKSMTVSGESIPAEPPQAHSIA